MAKATLTISLEISIHALREEGDPLGFSERSSTVKISIHALREEGDAFTDVIVKRYINFYPRPPRGGRPGFGGAYE